MSWGGGTIGGSIIYVSSKAPYISRPGPSQSNLSSKIQQHPKIQQHFAPRLIYSLSRSYYFSIVCDDNIRVQTNAFAFATGASQNSETELMRKSIKSIVFLTVVVVGGLCSVIILRLLMLNDQVTLADNDLPLESSISIPTSSSPTKSSTEAAWSSPHLVDCRKMISALELQPDMTMVNSSKHSQPPPFQ